MDILTEPLTINEWAYVELPPNGIKKMEYAAQTNPTRLRELLIEIQNRFQNRSHVVDQNGLIKLAAVADDMASISYFHNLISNQ